MGKPNFFVDTDVLNCLLGMQYDPKVSPGAYSDPLYADGTLYEK